MDDVEWDADVLGYPYSFMGKGKGVSEVVEGVWGGIVIEWVEGMESVVGEQV